MNDPDLPNWVLLLRKLQEESQLSNGKKEAKPSARIR